MKDLRSFTIVHFVHAVLAIAHARRASLDTALNRVHLTILLAKSLATRSRMPPEKLRMLSAH